MPGSNQASKTYKVAVANIVIGFKNDKVQLMFSSDGTSDTTSSWTLIHSFVYTTESLQSVAQRNLHALPNIQESNAYQLEAYFDDTEDLDEDCLCVFYVSLCRLAPTKQAQDEESSVAWFSIDQLPDLPKKQMEMVKKALHGLRYKIQREPIAFHLLDQKFTIPQLRLLYERITGKRLDYGNFSKKLHSMDILTRLDEKDKSQSKKGAYYYMFDEQKFIHWTHKGFSFDLK